MTNLRHMIIGFLMCGIPSFLFAQLPYQESFEAAPSGATYLTSVAFVNDGGGEDYFERGTDADFATHGMNVTLNGEDGVAYIAGEDLDAVGIAGAEAITTLAPINVTGFTGMQVTVAVAANSVSNNFDQADQANGDYLYVEYNLDGGGWTTIGAFTGGPGSNTDLREDTNFDFIGDGTTINETFQDFTYNIPGAGSSLEVRMRLRSDAGDEEIAFDHIRVTGSTCNISSIVLSNISACNDNGTQNDDTDDFFTADVTVTFNDAPPTGDLVLSGDGAATVGVGLIGPINHTFVGVQLPADGNPVSLTATFDAETTCTFTETNASAGINPCSPVVKFVSANSAVNETTGAHQISVTMSAAPVNTVTVQVADAGSGSALGGGIDYTFATQNLTFTPVEAYPNTKTVSITVVDDAPTNDPNEFVNLTMTITGGTAGLGLNTHQVTITETEAGLILNEFSQGPSGGREYVELLVVGRPGTTVDIRGWIFDDNNGIFSDGAGNSLGVAAGYVEFENICTWEQVPVGSLIVLYNAEDPNASLPADDPTDANLDYVYVVPISGNFTCTSPGPNAYLDANALSPNATDPSYPASNQDPCWFLVGFRNDGDGIQLRRPDASFFQGLSYGDEGTVSSCAGSTGSFPCDLRLENHPFYGAYGSDALYFTENGANRIFYFANVVNDDFNNRQNWITQVATGNETPGAANSANNNTYINSLRQDFIPTGVNSTYTCDWGAGESKVYLNPSDEIILFLENNGATDHGSTTGSVAFGGGTVQNNNLTGAPIFLDPDWTVTPTTTGAPNYNIRFYVSDAQLNAFAADVNTLLPITSYSGATIRFLLQVYKRTGNNSPKTALSDADVEVQIPFIGVHATTYATFEATYTSFSTYALGAPVTILPFAELELFAHSPAPGQVDLNWSLLGDSNPIRFWVHKSKDGVNFEPIAEVQGSEGLKEFQYRDQSAFAGKNYYRILQSNADGTFIYSETKEVSTAPGSGLTVHRVFPNPVSDVLFVNGFSLQSGPAHLTLLDAKGRRVFGQKSAIRPGNYTMEVPMANLPAGMYILILEQGGERVFRKVIRD